MPLYNQILESPDFVALPVLSAPASPGDSIVQRKLDSLANLKAGWHYGSGKAIHPASTSLGRLLANHASRLGIETVDAFPGTDGDLTISVYRGGEEFSFTINARGRIEFGSESQEVPDGEVLDAMQAMARLSELASLKSWKSFSLSTSRSMTLNGIAFGAWHSRTPPMEVEYRSLMVSAPFISQTQYAPMPAVITQVSLRNHPYFGSLMPPSSRELALSDRKTATPETAAITIFKDFQKSPLDPSSKSIFQKDLSKL
jgi:hypothetical protein